MDLHNAPFCWQSPEVHKAESSFLIHFSEPTQKEPPAPQGNKRSGGVIHFVVGSLMQLPDVQYFDPSATIQLVPSLQAMPPLPHDRGAIATAFTGVVPQLQHSKITRQCMMRFTKVTLNYKSFRHYYQFILKR
jgi:hypothetical protein